MCGGFDNSINGRHDITALLAIQYGFALSRFVQGLAATREMNLTKRILLMKFDADSAFKRLGLSLHSALKTFIIHKSIALMSTRMTFGGKASSNNWGAVAEILTDLANEALNKGGLKELTERPTNYEKYYAKPERLDPRIPIATMSGLLYKPPMGENRLVDIYVDDNFAACLDEERDGLHESKRIFNRILNCFDTIFAPALEIQEDRVTRDPAISLRKLEAEGVPREVHKILGWIVNTRLMTMALPADKVIEWVKEVKRTAATLRIEHKELEKLIGKVTRAAFILPGAMAFIVPLRRLLYPKTRGSITLKERHRLYLDRWPALLRLAGKGTRIERLVIREPTMVMFTDAAKYGMGGYHNESGVGWQFAFPARILEHTTINHLEFLAAVVGLIIMKLEDDGGSPHLLAWIDNSSAVSWMRKALSSDGFADFLFEAYCEIMLTADFTLWGAHLAGEKNFIADILSRDVESSISEVLGSIITKGKNMGLTQTSHLQIRTLPEIITSWLLRVLRTVMRPTPSVLHEYKGESTRGDGGSIFVQPWRSTKTWTGSFTRRHPGWRQPSWRTPDGDDFADQLGAQLRERTSSESSRRWLRPSSYEA